MQGKPMKAILFPVLAALCLLGVWGCGRDSGPAERPRVVTTIFPLGDMASAIGGELIEVSVLLPPRANPHSYEPLPTQAREVAEADLFIEVGLGLDHWAATVFRAAASDRAVVITAADLVEERLHHDFEPDAAKPHGHGHGRKHSVNPHIWLDPVMARDIAAGIMQALIRLDPANEAAYRERGERYLQKLAALDRTFADRLAPHRGRAFITLHPAWEYLAGRYGLVQRVTLLDAHGAELAPRTVSRAFETARAEGIDLLLAEPALNIDRFRDLARDFGVTVVELEPVGDPADPELDSYIGFMETNLNRITEAFGD